MDGFWQSVADDSDGALGNGLFNIIMPIGQGAANGYKYVTMDNFARIKIDLADANIRRSFDGIKGNPVQYVFEADHDNSSVMVFVLSMLLPAGTDCFFTFPIPTTLTVRPMFSSKATASIPAIPFKSGKRLGLLWALAS